MKKFLICCAVILSATCVGAENMKFVTLLSQPVGSFSRVELLDQTTPADIFHLNFCNTDAAGGTITLSSSEATPVDVDSLVVNPNATLGGDVDYFRADKVYVYSNLGFEGGTLSVDLTAPAKILVDDESSRVAEFIHNKSVTIKAADFNTLNIYNKAVLDTPASGSTLSSNLTWRKVLDLSKTHTTDDAYLLTDWSGSMTVDEPEEEDDSCVPLDCGRFGTWDPVSCKCKLNTPSIELPGGDGGRYCPAVQCNEGYTKDENCNCICSRLCPINTTLNRSTCTCVPNGGTIITPGIGRLPVTNITLN